MRPSVLWSYFCPFLQLIIFLLKTRIAALVRISVLVLSMATSSVFLSKSSSSSTAWLVSVMYSLLVSRPSRAPHRSLGRRWEAGPRFGESLRQMAYEGRCRRCYFLGYWFCCSWNCHFRHYCYRGRRVPSARCQLYFRVSSPSPRSSLVLVLWVSWSSLVSAPWSPPRASSSREVPLFVIASCMSPDSFPHP